MDAVIQHVGSCKVLTVEARSTTEHGHCDLAVCGISHCCPADGQKLGDLNAKSHVYLFSSQKK